MKAILSIATLFLLSFMTAHAQQQESPLCDDFEFMLRVLNDKPNMLKEDFHDEGELKYYDTKPLSVGIPGKLFEPTESTGRWFVTYTLLVNATKESATMSMNQMVAGTKACLGDGYVMEEWMQGTNQDEPVVTFLHTNDKGKGKDWESYSKTSMEYTIVEDYVEKGTYWLLLHFSKTESK